MQGWTGASFDAALDRDVDKQDPVLWLRSRGVSLRGPGRLARTLDALDRAGTRVGRLSTLVVGGFLACGTIPNSALAPVSPALAAVERFRLQPAFPLEVEDVSSPAASTVAEARKAQPVASAPPSASPEHELAPASPASAPVSAPVGHAPSLSPVACLVDLAPPPVRNLLSSVGLRFDDVPPRAHDLEWAPSFRPTLEEAQTIQDNSDEADEFLRFGSRELPRRLVETIVRAALATDVDPIYLMALADKESSFRTDVKASTSSAEGLFQFLERTWLQTVRQFGGKHGLATEAAAIVAIDDKPTVADEGERSRILELRRNPYVAAVMAAEMLRRDAALIGFRIGRELQPAEMYLAHFLGLEGAARFIGLRGAKRAQSATAAFPAAAKANTGIFFEKGKKGRRGLSVPEVYAKIDRMIDIRIEQFRPVQVFTVLAQGI